MLSWITVLPWRPTMMPSAPPLAGCCQQKATVLFFTSTTASGWAERVSIAA